MGIESWASSSGRERAEKCHGNSERKRDGKRGSGNKKEAGGDREGAGGRAQAEPAREVAGGGPAGQFSGVRSDQCDAAPAVGAGQARGRAAQEIRQYLPNSDVKAALPEPGGAVCHVPVIFIMCPGFPKNVRKSAADL